MLITAKSWLGRRTFVYDQTGERVRNMLSINTRTRTGVINVLDPNGHPSYTVDADGNPIPTGRKYLVRDGEVVTKTIDVTGFKLKFGNADGFIKLGE